MYHARLAQSEHWTGNPKVIGSIPALDFVNLLSTFYFPICFTTAYPIARFLEEVDFVNC